MKKYIKPEMKILSIDTKDICNSSGFWTELYDFTIDPHAEDIDNW